MHDLLQEIFHWTRAGQIFPAQGPIGYSPGSGLWINIRLRYMLAHVSTSFSHHTPPTAILSLPQRRQHQGAVGSAPHQPGPLQLPTATSSTSTLRTTQAICLKHPGFQQTYITCQTRAGATSAPMLVLGVPERSSWLDWVRRAMLSGQWCGHALVCPCSTCVIAYL